MSDLMKRIPFSTFIEKTDDSMLAFLGYEQPCEEAYLELQDMIHQYEGWWMLEGISGAFGILDNEFLP